MAPDLVRDRGAYKGTERERERDRQRQRQRQRDRDRKTAAGGGNVPIRIFPRSVAHHCCVSKYTIARTFLLQLVSLHASQLSAQCSYSRGQNAENNVSRKFLSSLNSCTAKLFSLAGWLAMPSNSVVSVSPIPMA